MCVHGSVCLTVCVCTVQVLVRVCMCDGGARVRACVYVCVCVCTHACEGERECMYVCTGWFGPYSNGPCTDLIWSSGEEVFKLKS